MKRRLPFPMHYQPPNLHAWRRYWRPEFRLMGLPTLGPVQLARHAAIEMRNYHRADLLADDALDELCASLIKRHSTEHAMRLLDQYNRHRNRSICHVDKALAINKAELHYLRPLVWHHEEWLNSR